jgi:hypothetical protein
MASEKSITFQRKDKLKISEPLFYKIKKVELKENTTESL